MAVAASTGTDGTATTGFAERGINRNYLFDIITPYQVFYKHIDMLKNITRYRNFIFMLWKMNFHEVE